MNLKFGLKLWSTNTALIDQAIQLFDEKIFDYIELFVVPDTQIIPFVIDIPYIIHIPHTRFGVNIGDATRTEYNLEKINESISWADKLNASYLILHAGHGSMESAKYFLNEFNDKRLLIENMPKVGLDGEAMIGYSPEQIEELIRVDELGLCLDIGHAIKAAVALRVEYKEYVKGFFGFEPNVFHISDGMLYNEKDEHLNIGKGEYDFRHLLRYVMNVKSKLITIETPRMNQNLLEEDILNVNLLKNILKNLK